jgi:hypothetical protein
MSLADINDVYRALEALSDPMTWAEEEIDAAQHRHPADPDRIWRSFGLLMPTHPLMGTESVYRAHCRELLDRVARTEDTRPGTAAECCVALSVTSQQVPLSTAAAGLYARMWRKAGLPPTELSDASEHYKALEGSLIDDHEAWLRTILRQPWRTPNGTAASTASGTSTGDTP